MNPDKLRRLHRHDRIAAWVIKCGGVSIIFSMITMIILLVKVAMPLFHGANIDLHQTWETDGETQLMGVDDYGETAYHLNKEGVLVFKSLVDPDAELRSVPLLAINEMETEADVQSSLQADEPSLSSEDQGASAKPESTTSFRANLFGSHEIALHLGNQIDLHKILFRPQFDEKGNRTIVNSVESLGHFESQSGNPNAMYEILILEGQSVLLEQTGSNSIAVVVKTVEEDMFGDIEESTQVLAWQDPECDIVSFAIGEYGTNFWVGSKTGKLYYVSIDDDQLKTIDRVSVEDGAGIDHLTAMLGRVSVAATTSAGNCYTYIAISDSIQNTHQLASGLEHVEGVYASRRHKNVIFLQETKIRAVHMTSEKVLFNFSHAGNLKELSLTDRGDFLSGLSSNGQVWMWHVDSPHPEISFKSLWQKVWYEGYREPAYTWQSSSASDDFEPKMSLVPLVFGSLKGTFYGMLFALPLAILGALYTSQIMRPRYKKIIKPTIELMAAVPSVIVGFLGALWLAPIVEKNLMGIFILPFVLFAAAIVGGKLVATFKHRNQYEGREFIWIFPTMIISVFLAMWIGDLFEGLLFNGDLKLWVFQTFETQVDQRNSIVISFALGFAVIPVIFTIAEDAMSNVPQGMVAGSLALGANLWQTVRRIVLPMASPGIFAAIMIGFGRAVGETMIVLMATGNTPIMDVSMFNGMRTLAANIAVEIPEAPVDGSLYRLLFLSALLLFLMTFIVNTLAEFVRSRLRRKYGQD